MASPKFEPWWVLWIHVCSWFIPAPKNSNSVLTNLLFGLCKSTWIIELLVFHPSPILKLQHALLPPKCCKPRSMSQFLLLLLSSPLDSQLSPSKSLGVRHPVANHREYYKGEGGGFPKSRSWWVLWVCVCPWFIHALKVLQVCTNQLLIWFVQVHMNNWPSCHSS